jgi:hypothetical protein
MPRTVVVDIETIPCPDSMRSLIPVPRPSAPLPLWRRLFQRDNSLEEAYLQTSLNWTFGRIVCIGLLVAAENGPPHEHAFIAPILPSDSPAESLAKEQEVLRSFWGFVAPDDYFVGHNILNFDLPFLWNRSLICNVCPSRSLHLCHESTQFTFDTMQVWAHWPDSSRNRQYVRLSTLTQVLALPSKSGSGSQVYDLWRRQKFDEIRSYCLNDVRIEYDLYLRLTLQRSAPPLDWDCSHKQ